MKNFKFKRSLSILLCIIAVLCSVVCTACNNTTTTTQNTSSVSSTLENAITIGEGEHQFNLVIVDNNGTTTNFDVHTNERTVGSALYKLNLIEGDQGEYGLYVKTVNGITADYNTDKTYWAFYINDKYANNSVDNTTITDGATYSFKVQK